MWEIRKGDLKAKFLPEKGMNFVSYTKGAIEAIDQSTLPLFEERYAGLGAMIGPHFHRRNPAVIPSLPKEEAFPHVAALKAKGEKEYFSHGIGRYAPWDVVEKGEEKLIARLRGNMEWNGVLLKEIEGQDFTMSYEARMSEKGLEITLGVVGETEAVVGLHTYYALYGGGAVYATVQDEYNVGGEFKKIPWHIDKDQLVYPLDKDTDFGFLSAPDPLHGKIDLVTATHTVRVQYWSDNAECSWQLWHPKGSSFACVEPIAAKNPRKVRLSVNKIKILISLL
ncbi:MAG: hypothetical protein ACKVOH_06900 [Chlamydiales bacterium]